MTTWTYSPTQQNNYALSVDGVFSLSVDGSQSLLAEGSNVTSWGLENKTPYSAGASLTWGTATMPWSAITSTWATATTGAPSGAFWVYTPTAELLYSIQAGGGFLLTADGSQFFSAESGSETTWTYTNRT